MNKLFISLLLTLGISGLAHAAGDAAAGQGKIAICSACHNADGNSLVSSFPKLAGQGERYLLKQMQDIKSGNRPIVEMTGMLDAMTAQDLEDISAWYNSQKGTLGAADPELAERGQELYQGGKLADGMPACIGCHSPNGEGIDLAVYPKLNGQHADYIAKQLTEFREGIRNNDGDSMIMRTIAAKMSNKDIKAVSSYIQGLN